MWSKLLILAVVVMLTACGGNPQKPMATASDETSQGMHNAENSLDYVGVYKGTLPAADCPGIEITLVLEADQTCSMISHYIERDTFAQKGTYTVENNLLTVHFEKQGDAPDFYKIEENRLMMLDNEKQPITGELAAHYILNKTK
ncbi:MAG: copper resistance protein NlpE [Alistipes sp.]